MSNAIKVGSIRPLHDNVIVYTDEPQDKTLPSGIVIPVAFNPAKLHVGKLDSYGSKIRDVVLHDAAKYGHDILYFAGASELYEDNDGKFYRMLKADNIIAVRKPSDIFPLVCQSCGSLLDGDDVPETKFSCPTCKKGYTLPWYQTSDRVFYVGNDVPEKIGSIILPTGEFVGGKNKYREQTGTVIACGHGYWKGDKFTQTQISVGQTVVIEKTLPPSWSFDVEINGVKEKVKFCGSNDIYMVLENAE